MAIKIRSELFKLTMMSDNRLLRHLIDVINQNNIDSLAHTTKNLFKIFTIISAKSGVNFGLFDYKTL